MVSKEAEDRMEELLPTQRYQRIELVKDYNRVSDSVLNSLLQKQKNLFKNKSIISRLPDKGAKVKLTIESIEKVLSEREQLCDSLGGLKIDGPPDPHSNFPLQGKRTFKSNRSINNQKPSLFKTLSLSEQEELLKSSTVRVQDERNEQFSVSEPEYRDVVQLDSDDYDSDGDNDGDNDGSDQ